MPALTWTPEVKRKVGRPKTTVEKERQGMGGKIRYGVERQIWGGRQGMGWKTLNEAKQVTKDRTDVEK